MVTLAVNTPLVSAVICAALSVPPLHEILLLYAALMLVTSDMSMSSKLTVPV